MKRARGINIFLSILAGIAFLFPFLLVIQSFIFGNTPFWYDPARDFLLAWDNLQKVTLIGPTSGIPGIFYGPYWIWLISFGLLFSKDPSIVVFIVSALPYFIILPILLWKMSSMFGKVTVIILWLLFMLSTGFIYATRPWNPHPAPLMFIALIYVITNTDFLKKGNKKFLATGLIGILTGLILNFHISFGVGVAVGTFVFLSSYTIYHVYGKKNKISWKTCVLLLCSFIIGLLAAFLPFFLFEIRHGFHQIQTAINVFTAKGSVVSVTGLSDGLIVENFFTTAAKLLYMPLPFALIGLTISALLVIYQIRKKQFNLTRQENKLLLFLATTTCTILALYLSSKNPVWGYHFIGVEILFLFLIGFLLHKNVVLKTLLACWVVVLVLLQIPNLVAGFNQDNVISSSLAERKKIVQMIRQDAKESAYTVFAYSPSIYTYEYTYLFKWLAQKDIPYDPGQVSDAADIVYIVVPKPIDGKIHDFIQYRAPDQRYKTEATWDLVNNIQVIKKSKKDY